MEKCKWYFIDDAGQGFTVPCCSLGEDPSSVTCLYSGKEYKTFVNCCGSSFKCDIVKQCIEEKRNGKYD